MVEHRNTAKEIKNLDTDMQQLVTENYHKFIAATDTIRSMKTEVDKTMPELTQLSAIMSKCVEGDRGQGSNPEWRHALTPCALQRRQRVWAQHQHQQQAAGTSGQDGGAVSRAGPAAEAAGAQATANSGYELVLQQGLSRSYIHSFANTASSIGFSPLPRYLMASCRRCLTCPSACAPPSRKRCWTRRWGSMRRHSRCCASTAPSPRSDRSRRSRMWWPRRFRRQATDWCLCGMMIGHLDSMDEASCEKQRELEGHFVEIT